MRKYHFTVQYRRFSAELAVDERCSLYALARLIIKALGFHFDHCFEFCDNLKDPYQSKERYTLFADVGEEADDPGVKKTRVAKVFRPERKMIFHFDYGDDWYFPITCTAVTRSTATRAIREIIATWGTPPIQYKYDEE